MSDEVPGNLSESDRARLRDVVAAERGAVCVRIAALTRDFDAIVESSSLTGVDDEHDPDGSTTGFERAQVASLLRQARSRLVDLDRARERMRDGVYGVCARCGHRIVLERLMAHPSAQTCVDCAAAPTGSVT